MKLTSRERSMVLGAAIAAAAFLLFLAVRSRGSESAEDDTSSLAGIQALAERKVEQRERLETISKSMSVKLPTASPDEQVENIVKGIEAVVGKSSVELSSLSPRGTSSRTKQRRAGNIVGFEIRFASDHNGLFNFLKGLREEGLPHRVESLHVKTRQNEPSKLDVEMDLGFVLLRPMPVKKEPKKEEEKKEDPKGAQPDAPAGELKKPADAKPPESKNPPGVPAEIKVKLPEGKPA